METGRAISKVDPTQLNNLPIPSLPAVQEYDKSFATIRARQLAFAFQTSGVIEAINARLSQLDLECDELMMQLNGIVRRERGGKVICRWDIEDIKRDSANNPAGPTFYTRNRFARSFRVSSNGRNVLTKKLLAACYLTRYETKYLA